MCYNENNHMISTIAVPAYRIILYGPGSSAACYGLARFLFIFLLTSMIFLTLTSGGKHVPEDIY